MKKFFSRLLKLFNLIWQVDWLRTFYINFRSLPIQQAIHLPILLYNARIRNSSGKILVRGKVKFGMIRLGYWYTVQCKPKPGIIIMNNGILEFEGSCLVGSSSIIEISETGRLIFGKNVSISGECNICSRKLIQIGENFSCSWNTGIYDTDFHVLCTPKDDGFHIDTKSEPKPIYIGKDNWLCQRALILKGTTLPDRCIVGAGSIVKGNFTNMGVNIAIAGNPAKKIKDNITRIEFVRFETKPIESIVKHCGL